jgi:hypothetical protein
MPIPRPVPPDQFKKVMEYHGYVVVEEDALNWLMDHPERPSDPPIPIPKLGPLISVEAMMNALDKAHITDGMLFKALSLTTN